MIVQGPAKIVQKFSEGLCAGAGKGSRRKPLLELQFTAENDARESIKGTLPDTKRGGKTGSVPSESNKGGTEMTVCIVSQSMSQAKET